jgi:hypothetical protein
MDGESDLGGPASHTGGRQADRRRAQRRERAGALGTLHRDPVPEPRCPSHRRGHRRRVGTQDHLESTTGRDAIRARGAGVPRWAMASVEHVLAAPGSACHACGVPVPRPQGSCGPTLGWGELIRSADAQISRRGDVKGNVAVVVAPCPAVPQSKGRLNGVSAKSKEFPGQIGSADALRGASAEANTGRRERAACGGIGRPLNLVNPGSDVGGLPSRET